MGDFSVVLFRPNFMLFVALHIERRGFLHFMWRYRMEVHGSLSQLTEGCA
jgi:hypothetical protein